MLAIATGPMEYGLAKALLLAVNRLLPLVASPVEPAVQLSSETIVLGILPTADQSPHLSSS